MEQAGDDQDDHRKGSRLGKPALAKPREEAYVALTFPQRLMEVLEEKSYVEVVSWLDHGRAFMIHQEYPFTQDIMPRHFNKSSKFSSFNRKLTRWGFVRINRGPDLGAIYHPLFQRGQHKLLSRMSCQSGKTSSIPNSPLQRDYYRQTGRMVDEDGNAARIPASEASTAPSETTSRATVALATTTESSSSAAATPHVRKRQQQEPQRQPQLQQGDTSTVTQSLGGLSQTLGNLSAAQQLHLLQQIQTEQHTQQSMANQLQEAIKIQQMHNLLQSLSQEQQRQQEAQLRLRVLAQLQAQQQLNQLLANQADRSTLLSEPFNPPVTNTLEQLLALQHIQQGIFPLARSSATGVFDQRDHSTHSEAKDDTDEERKAPSSKQAKP